MASSSPHQTPDPIISVTAVSDIMPTLSESMKEHVTVNPSVSAKNERPATLKPSQDSTTIGHSVHAAAQPGSFSSRGDLSVYPPNVYAPQPQAFYYKGYDSSNGQWDEYSQFVNPEGVELGFSGMYNENSSLMFHTGYGYSPQMPYGPYSPVTPPLPSVGGDAYSTQQYQFSGPSYYQPMPYSPTPGSQQDLTSLGSLDQQPSYHPSLGGYGGGNFSTNTGSSGFHDLPQSYDGARSGGLWSDWSTPSDRQRSYAPLSPAATQPIGRNGSFGQNFNTASQQQRSMYGHGSGSSSYNKSYHYSGFNPGSSFGSSSVSSMGTNGRSWLAFDNSRRGRDSSSLYNCNGTLDILGEQNKGPRASKPKALIINDHIPSKDNDKYTTSSIKMHEESYNRPDFATELEDAKFFIIKSYSEDNVHKSIKYNIWASTPNGNKKLDAAYQEAKEKQGVCPVYLLFSVNASAQFCGVAEMIGHVDFDKSVDYWQQDKWSGQFPVKWHIIKDVPNSQFRHILLENNDNKPVTNSRDTQEVKFDQGVEMLKIFKNYENDMSILDDFDFYEDRQKAMEDRKTRQQQQQQLPSLRASTLSVDALTTVGIAGGNDELHNAVVLPSDFLKKMSKSFAQAVTLEESTKEVYPVVVSSDSGSAIDLSPI